MFKLVRSCAPSRMIAGISTVDILEQKSIINGKNYCVLDEKFARDKLMFRL